VATLLEVSVRSPEPFNAEVGAAWLGFNGEAVPYCQGISEADAHEYAMDYARMLRSRAKGRAFEKTHFSTHLFGPNQKLIKATLDRMYRKHFAA
jgi:hypothetical protein